MISATVVRLKHHALSNSTKFCPLSLRRSSRSRSRSMRFPCANCTILKPACSTSCDRLRRKVIASQRDDAPPCTTWLQDLPPSAVGVSSRTSGLGAGCASRAAIAAACYSYSIVRATSRSASLALSQRVRMRYLTRLARPIP